VSSYGSHILGRCGQSSPTQACVGGGDELAAITLSNFASGA
jgi:hypothetical protein